MRKINNEGSFLKCLCRSLGYSSMLVFHRSRPGMRRTEVPAQLGCTDVACRR